MSKWAGSIGMVSSLVGSITSYASQRNALKDANASAVDSWNKAAQETRDQLTIAYNRTLTSLNEVNRDKIYTKIAARKAGIKATGQVAVQAAQLGIEGRRGVNMQEREINSEVANTISDAEINSQIQAINVTNAYTDAATSAVYNLNSQAPTSTSIPSTASMIADTLGAGVNYYNKLSPAQKSDMKENFNWTVNKIKSIKF